MSQVVKNPPANPGDWGSIPWSGRSPGGGKGNPLQYSFWDNPIDRNLVGYSPWGHKVLGMTERARTTILLDVMDYFLKFSTHVFTSSALEKFSICLASTGD